MSDDGFPCYGYFLGGDPRCFHPDSDGLLADELERWKVDCEAWDNGNEPDRGGPHITLVDGEERACGWLTVSHYGLGTNETAPDPNWREAYAVLAANRGQAS